MSGVRSAAALKASVGRFSQTEAVSTFPFGREACVYLLLAN